MNIDHFPKIRNTIATVFGIDPAGITPQTNQSDIAEWDSVGHLNLMLSLEETFHVKLEVEDMIELTSVAAIDKFLENSCRS